MYFVLNLVLMVGVLFIVPAALKLIIAMNRAVIDVSPRAKNAMTYAAVWGVSLAVAMSSYLDFSLARTVGMMACAALVGILGITFGSFAYWLRPTENVEYRQFMFWFDVRRGKIADPTLS